MKSQLISYLELFHCIPEADAGVIESYFDQESYKEGDILFPGQKACNDMFFVTSGVLRIVTVNERGIDITHYFYKENQVCTILPSFNDGSRAEAGIRAACDARVLKISRSSLSELCVKIPYMKDVIDEINQQRLIEKVHLRNAYIGEDAESQYKLFIMQHADIALRVPLKDIASFLGITPQSLSRIRKNIR
ncbi:Crp/Fnr family transcriptional regulator [Chitinophagaceae bacterium MMS25-I14]